MDPFAADGQDPVACQFVLCYLVVAEHLMVSPIILAISQGFWSMLASKIGWLAETPCPTFQICRSR